MWCNCYLQQFSFSLVTELFSKPFLKTSVLAGVNNIVLINFAPVSKNGKLSKMMASDFAKS